MSKSTNRLSRAELVRVEYEKVYLKACWRRRIFRSYRRLAAGLAVLAAAVCVAAGVLAARWSRPDVKVEAALLEK